MLLPPTSERNVFSRVFLLPRVDGGTPLSQDRRYPPPRTGPERMCDAAVRLLRSRRRTFFLHYQRANQLFHFISMKFVD